MEVDGDVAKYLMYHVSISPCPIGFILIEISIKNGPVFFDCDQWNLMLKIGREPTQIWCGKFAAVLLRVKNYLVFTPTTKLCHQPLHMMP